MKFYLLLLYSLVFTCEALLPLSMRIGVVFPQVSYNSKLYNLDNYLRSAVNETNLRQDVLNSTRVDIFIKYTEDATSFYSHQTVCDIIKYGLITLLGSPSPILNDGIVSVSSTLHIPHLSISTIEEKVKEAFTLNLSPTIDETANAIVSVLQYLEIKKLGILYHGESGILKIDKFIEPLQMLNIQFFLFELKTKDIRSGLAKLDEAGITDYVLDISEDLIRHFLLQALQSGIIHRQSTFIVTSPDILLSANDFGSSIRYSGTNFIGISLFSSPPSSKFLRTTTGALLHDAYQVFIQSMMDISKDPNEELFESSTIVSCGDPETKYNFGQKIFSAMKNVIMEGNTGHIQFDSQTHHRTNYSLYIYKLTSNGEMTNVGRWYQQKLHIFNEEFVNTNNKIRFRKKKTTLYVFNNLETIDSTFQNYAFNVLSDMDFTNLSLKIMESKKDQNHNRHQNITGLKEQEIILMIGNSISEEFDMSSPLLSFELSLLKRNLNKFIWLSPFPFETWIVFLSIYFAASFLLFLLLRLSPYQRNVGKDNHWILRNIDENDVGLESALWYLTPPGIFLASISIKSISGRIFLTSYLLYLFGIGILYMKSFDSKNFTPLKIELESLYSNVTYLSVIDSSSLQTLFPLQSFSEIYDVNQWLETETAEQTYLILPTYQLASIRHKCSYSVMSLNASLQISALFKKGSSFKDPFNSSLNKLIMNGHLEELKRKWMNGLNLKNVISLPNDILTSNDLLIAFSIGVLCSFTVAFVEFLVFLYQKRNEIRHMTTSEILQSQCFELLWKKSNNSSEVSRDDSEAPMNRFRTPEDSPYLRNPKTRLLESAKYRP